MSEFTTNTEKNKMRVDIALEKGGRKGLRNFVLSRPDINSGKGFRMRMEVKDAYRFIGLGYKVIQALDQSPLRKRKKQEKMPEELL